MTTVGEQFQVLTFGRGAHGRLGNGTNKNQPSPVLVANFPDSFTAVQATSNMYIRAIACGGAHTLLLCSTHVKKGLAFPFGVQTFVYAWGYGANGQLGTGGRDHCFLPVKTRMPKAEVIVEIAAGRSWSVARTFGGKLYSWGKGLRGQLGQGQAIGFSLVPRHIETHASYIKRSANYAHNIGICVQRKYFNDHLVEKKYLQCETWLKEKQEKLVEQGADLHEVSTMKHEMEDIFTYHERFLTLAPLRSRAMYEINCCKRNTFLSTNAMTNTSIVARERTRYHCLTCKVDFVCYVCTITCHRGHTLVQSSLMNEVKALQATLTPSSTITVGKSLESHHNGLSALAASRSGFSKTPVSSKGPSVASSSSTSRPNTSGGNAIAISLTSSSSKGVTRQSMKLRASQSIIPVVSIKSKNPLDWITISTHTLRYDDALPSELSHTSLTATTARAFHDNLYNYTFNHPCAKLLVGTEPSVGITNYLEKGTILFPRDLKQKLPLNIYNQHLRYVEEGLLGQSFDFYDFSAQKIDYSLIQSVVRDHAQVAYQIKFMERYPRRLLNYQILANQIQNRVVRRDKDRMKLKKRTSFDMSNEAYANAMASTNENRENKAQNSKKKKKSSTLSSSRGQSSSFASSTNSLSSITSDGSDSSSHANANRNHGNNAGQVPVYFHSLTNSLKKLVPACHCALFHDHCQLLANIPESSEEEQKTKRAPHTFNNHLKFYYANKHLQRQQAIFKDDQKVTTKHQQIHHYYTAYVIRIQALVRRYISKCRFMKLQIALSAIRRQVVTEHVEKSIFKVVFNKVKRVYATYREDEERKAMKYEDELMDKYNKYKKLQKNIMAMKVMLLGARYLLSKASIHYPVRVSDHLPNKTASVFTHKMTERQGLVTLYNIPSNLPSPTSLRTLSEVNMYSKVLKATLMANSGIHHSNELMLPSFAFSWSSLRAQQLMLHPLERIPPAMMALLTQYYPRHVRNEGMYFDADISDNFLSPFLQTKDRLYAKLHKLNKSLNKVRATAERAEAALKALKQKQQLQQNRGPKAIGLLPSGGGGGGGMFNSKLLSALAKPTSNLRVKLHLVHVFQEQLAIYSKIFNHNFNHTVSNVLTMYRHDKVTAEYCLEILKATPFSTLLVSTDHDNHKVKHLVQALNQIYYKHCNKSKRSWRPRQPTRKPSKVLWLRPKRRETIGQARGAVDYWPDTPQPSRPRRPINRPTTVNQAPRRPPSLLFLPPQPPDPMPALTPRLTKTRTTLWSCTTQPPAAPLIPPSCPPWTIPTAASPTPQSTR